MAGGPQQAAQVDLSTLVASLQALTQTLGNNARLLNSVLSAGIAVLSAPASYTVAALPATAAAGAFAWASNGRKPGEASGAGTGVPVFFNPLTSNWWSYLSNSSVPPGPVQS